MWRSIGFGITGIGAVIALVFWGLDAKGAVTLWLPTLGWSGIGFALFFVGVLGLLYGFHATHPVPGHVATAKPEISEGRFRELANWMQGLVDADYTQFGERVMAWPKKPMLHLNEDPPSIDFVFDVANATVFLIYLGKEVDGYVYGGGRKLIQRLDVVPTDGLMHGARREVHITQYLSSDDVNAILSYKQPQEDNAPVPFDFVGLNVWVTSHESPGLQSCRARLKIPNPVYISIAALVSS